MIGESKTVSKSNPHTQQQNIIFAETDPHNAVPEQETLSTLQVTINTFFDLRSVVFISLGGSKS